MNRLKELRKEKSITQQELADEIGVTKLSVSNWENGKHEIKSDKAQTLADYFGVSIGYLLNYTDIRKQYDDEVVRDLGFVNPMTGSSALVYSLKRSYDEDFNAFVKFLKSIHAILSDSQVKTIFDLIQSMNLEDENNYLSRLITYDVLATRNVDEFYNEMSQQGYSLLIDTTQNNSVE